MSDPTAERPEDFASADDALDAAIDASIDADARPLQKEASLEDVDDVLSDMADEAIGRMLEGDFSEESPRPVRRADDTPAANPPVATPATQGVLPAMPTDEELDALLRGDLPPPQGAAVEAVLPEREATPEPMSSVALAVASELDAEASRTTPTHTASKPAPVVASDPPAHNVPGGTLWLLPLVWFNAPFARLPVTWRDAAGKIAVVTLFNAAVVMAYALLARGG